MRLLAALALTFTIAAGGAMGQDNEAKALVDAFTGVCVPQRLSFEGTKAQAVSLGWREIAETEHPELAAMMDKARAGLVDPELEFTFAYTTYAGAVAGRPHHLVISRTSAMIENDPFTEIGCYIYDFDATAPADPVPVTAFVGKPISHSIEDNGLVSHVWGPPCPLPRTGDTYLSFIAEGSPHSAATGFSGQVLKFATSEPDPGEVVPETYC